MKHKKKEVQKLDFKLILLYSLLAIAIIGLIIYILWGMDFKFKSKTETKVEIKDEIGRFGKDIFHLIPEEGTCNVKCMYKCKEMKMETKNSEFSFGSENRDERNSCECTCFG